MMAALFYHVSQLPFLFNVQQKVLQSTQIVYTSGFTGRPRMPRSSEGILGGL
jgi:hypothetical protein